MVSRFGRYELLRSLGRGGMGEVFLARQRGVGGFEKRLVIKRIVPLLAQDPRFLRLFFEEARLHAGLSHGNLVSIFDFGRVGNDYFLAMELVDGCDLAALMRAENGKPLPPEIVAHIGAELSRALQHVHRRSLVHRDLTPRNVLLSLDGEVKLADFGIARDATDDDVGVRGTVGYMAPEQARGETVGASADLYALGMVIAEAALGTRIRRSHGTDAHTTQLAAVAQQQAVSIDGPFRAIVHRATAPNPADRYPDAEAMAVAFESLATQFGGSRAGAARMLAEKVHLSAPPLLEEESGEAPPDPDVIATYYRDATTDASVVDEILAGPTLILEKVPRETEPRRRSWMFVAIAATILMTAAVVRSLRGSTVVSEPTPLTSTVPVSAPDLSTTIESLAPSAKEPSIVEGTRRRDLHAVSKSVIEVRCEPWCVVAVDGQRRGEDAQRHTLRVSTGRHRVTAERLEDRQQRLIDVTPDQPQSLDFVFE